MFFVLHTVTRHGKFFLKTGFLTNLSSVRDDFDKKLCSRECRCDSDNQKVIIIIITLLHFNLKFMSHCWASDDHYFI